MSLTDVTVSAGAEPLNYYFVETKGTRPEDIRNGIKRHDLPQGHLKRGQKFKLAKRLEAKSTDKHLCILARNEAGALVGSACDAEGVILATPHASSGLPRNKSTERKRPQIRGLSDLPERDLGTIRITTDPPATQVSKEEEPSWIFIIFWWVVLALIIYFLIKLLLKMRD